MHREDTSPLWLPSFLFWSIFISFELFIKEPLNKVEQTPLGILGHH